MKTASFHWDNVDELLMQIIPWLAGHESEIRPASALVTNELVAAGVRTRDDLKQIATEKGPAILAAANDLKAGGHTPRQVVLRAMLAAGIPADPARRALIERVATHVDAIVADFDAWFLSWEHLAADPNAWQTGDIDRFLHIKDRGGFGALSSQEWGLEWWVIIFIDGDGGGYFDPAASMQFTFAVKWQQVLGLNRASINTGGFVAPFNLHWVLAKSLPMLPPALDAIKPDLSSREAWERHGREKADVYHDLFEYGYTYFEYIDPALEWTDPNFQDGDGTIGGVVAAFQRLQPHIKEMIDDLNDRLDPHRWPRDRLVAWMLGTNACRDFKKAVLERKDGTVKVPGSLPDKTSFCKWLVREFEGITKPNPNLKEALLSAGPMAREMFAFLATRVFSSVKYADMWHETRYRDLDKPQARSDAACWLFLLAWAIEWRARLGFEVPFPFFDEEIPMSRMDPRLPAFGLPPFPTWEPDGMEP